MVLKKSLKILLLLIIIVIISLIVVKPWKKTIPVIQSVESRKKAIPETARILSDNKDTLYNISNFRDISGDNSFAAPFWSPDGKSIAVTNFSFSMICITDPEGKKVKKITDEPGSGFRFSWSPDSRQIAFLSRIQKEGESINSIKVANVETGSITDLTRGIKGVSMPGFSKDGIVYSLNGKLMLQRLTNKANLQITGSAPPEILADNVPANIISTSPSGSTLIIEDNEGIRIMDKNGRNRKTIVSNHDTDFACNSQFSPDGSLVLYFNNIGKSGHLFVWNSHNEKVSDLGEGNYGQWMSDGNIIFCVTTSNGYVVTGSEIYIINPDGSRKTKVTGTENQIALQPAVSPDGKSITYRDDKSGKIIIANLTKKSE